MKPGVQVALAFAIVVAVAHLVRLALRIPITIGGVGVPMWPSVVAIPLFAGLAYWIWRDSRSAAGRDR